MYINNKIIILLLFVASEILSCRSMSRYDEVEEGGDIGRSLSQRIFLSDLLQGTGRFMGADQIEHHYLLSGSQNISL